MRYCSRCLYPENHPLYLTFDDQGVCSGCRVHEEKDVLDWAGRLGLLREIVNEYRVETRTIHDCIVPVSGARDSYFIIHIVKNILGLNPLLVAYNMHYNTRRGIRNLAYLRTHFGCDIMNLVVAPDRVRRVTRESLSQLGSMYWHCLAGQTAFPVQTAVKFKIPLIIWGAHQGIDQVGMFSHRDEVEMTRKYRQEHDLMNTDVDDLVANANYLDESDVELFRYPHDAEIAAVGVRGIYLNNYIRWDTKAQHEQMIDLYGYETAPQLRTFDTYNDVDSHHYSGLHDVIKYKKWGYAKVSDHATREIRLKRMTREEGIAMVRRYESIEPTDLPLFLDWIGMSQRELWSCVDRFRDPRIWRRDEDGQWVLLDSVVNHVADENVNSVRLPASGDCRFVPHQSRSRQGEDGYVLIGRGWADDEG